jgi:hypothetical protein
MKMWGKPTTTKLSKFFLKPKKTMKLPSKNKLTKISQMKIRLIPKMRLSFTKAPTLKEAPNKNIQSRRTINSLIPMMTLERSKIMLKRKNSIMWRYPIMWMKRLRKIKSMLLRNKNKVGKKNNYPIMVVVSNKQPLQTITIQTNNNRPPNINKQCKIIKALKNPPNKYQTNPKYPTSHYSQPHPTPPKPHSPKIQPFPFPIM